MNSITVAKGNVGIRNVNPIVPFDILGDVRINGNLIITDPTSAGGPMTFATTSTSGNTLAYANIGLATFTLQHNSIGGTSSIFFPSTVNRTGADFGYIQYFDNLPYSGNPGNESALLVIGVENDAVSYGPDRIAIMASSTTGSFQPPGYVGINTIYPTYPLHVVGDAYQSASSSWTTGSDKRIKENIVDADLDICYDNCKNLKLKYFKWKDFVSFKEDQHVLGFIADEVLEIFPKSVKKITKEIFKKRNEKGDIETVEIPDFLTLNTDAIDKTMYGTIQKLINISETQEKIIQLQEEELKMIESKYEFLEKIVAAL